MAYFEGKMASNISTAEDNSSLDDLLSHYGLERNSLEEECSQEIRNKLSLQFINWKVIGSLLGLSKDDIKAIEEKNDSSEERRMATLNTWHQQKGYEATYLSLIKIFYNHKYRSLAGSLCEMIKEHSAATLPHPGERQQQQPSPAGGHSVGAFWWTYTHANVTNITVAIL